MRRGKQGRFKLQGQEVGYAEASNSDQIEYEPAEKVHTCIEEKTMGTDYYLIDPKAREVQYIDRSGASFCCAYPGPERQEVEGWPHGPVRVVTAEVLAALKADLDSEDWDDERTLDAWRWCRGRALVLLVDDHSPDDEAAFAFCHRVAYHRSVAGWRAAADVGTTPCTKLRDQGLERAKGALALGMQSTDEQALEQVGTLTAQQEDHHDAINGVFTGVLNRLDALEQVYKEVVAPTKGAEQNHERRITALEGRARGIAKPRGAWDWPEKAEKRITELEGTVAEHEASRPSQTAKELIERVDTLEGQARDAASMCAVGHGADVQMAERLQALEDKSPIIQTADMAVIGALAGQVDRLEKAGTVMNGKIAELDDMVRDGEAFDELRKRLDIHSTDIANLWRLLDKGEPADEFREAPAHVKRFNPSERVHLVELELDVGLVKSRSWRIKEFWGFVTVKSEHDDGPMLELEGEALATAGTKDLMTRMFAVMGDRWTGLGRFKNALTFSQPHDGPPRAYLHVSEWRRTDAADDGKMVPNKGTR